MLYTVRINLNNEWRVFDGVEERETLLDLLRDKAGIKSCKRGCDSGECGACTVLLNGAVVNSCCYLALQADGKAVATLEGLKGDDGGLHPIQQAFIYEGAVQCGFCIPGMILAAKALLDGNPAPSSSQIRAAMSGNICRCTGYAKIEKAVESAAEAIRKKSGNH